MHVLPDPGEHGRGFQLRPGDSFVIPGGWLKLSLNPLESTGRLFRGGLDMLAARLFLEDMHRKEEGYAEAAFALEKRTDEIVNSFSPLAGLDINDGSHAEKILTIMEGQRSTREFWALWTGQFLSIARSALEAGEASRAVWATACAERCRSMMVFKESLEEVVWMGQSAKRILDILQVWDTNRDNSDEEFWQLTFNENSYVLSQVFAVPMIFLKDKPYVGGMKLDRSDSRFIDYLFAAEPSREAILIEIKTPATRLLSGSDYRGIRPPSRDLAGSVVQVLDYRSELMRNLHSLTEGTKFDVSAFTPRCAVLIGNAEKELQDAKNRRSFELFRASLKDVEVITYDELFRKVEILAELFSLKRERRKEESPPDASSGVTNSPKK
jgi:hypothetical protein